jgi:HJR/Mrr/RecB family endonuclease
MQRSEQARAIYDTQNELWNYLESLVPQLLEPVPDESDDAEIVAGWEPQWSDYRDLDYLWMEWDGHDFFEHAQRVGNWERLLSLMRSLRLALDNRNLALVLDVFSDIDSCIDRIEMPVRVNFEVKAEVEDALLELEQVYPQLVYRGADEQIQLPGKELILEASTALAHQVAKDPALLHRLTPREFEEFIAELFSWFGYEVHLTARTRDGGRDIVAVRGDHGILSKLLIECKRFAPARPVGLSYVRELYAVKTLEKATKAILATTSHFTRDARRLERQLIYELELKDFEAVIAWTREYSKFLSRIRHSA